VVAGVVVLAFLIAGAGARWWYARRAPQRALVALAAAIHKRDSVAVERAVDFPALSKQVVDEAITVAKVDNLRDPNTTGLSDAVSSDMYDKMAPTVARSFEMSLRASLSKTADSAADHTPMLVEPLVRLSEAVGGGLPVYGATPDSVALASTHASDGVEWQGFGETRRRGDTALVPLTVRDRELPKPITLTMRLVPRDGAWTLIALDRVGDVLEGVRNQRKGIVDAYNANMLARLKGTLAVGDLSRSVTSDAWGINTWVRLSVPVTNKGDKPVTVALLESASADADIVSNVGFIRIGSSTPLAPGQTGTFVYLLSYNPYIDWHKTIRYGDLDGLTPQPVYVVRQVGTGLDTLAKVGGWPEYVRRVLRR